MLFNSYNFIFWFLPITLGGFYALAHLRVPRLADAWLVLASFTFYALWNVYFLPTLLLSIAFNYAVGRRIAASAAPAARHWLVFGVGSDLVLLAWTKYLGFFIRQLDALTGLTLHAPYHSLPLGISFFTFTQIAYLVDLSRREAAVDPPDRYALFVSFFPHLIAGPILHHRAVMPQFAEPRHLLFDQANFAQGLMFFTIGLAKKVCIADAIAPWSRVVFDYMPPSLEAWPAWLGALSYALQLYFDFSGYSDMAVGLGLMLNIRLPFNFASPYRATSIAEFWRRWHMSLSAFLRDYLYIPLGGNRHGEVRRYANLLLTMALGGLWHGAGLTFLVWGILHGSYLVINHLWRRLGGSLPGLLAGPLTFAAVLVGWVFFRAPNLTTACQIIQAMGGVHGLGVPVESHLLALALLLGVVTACPNSQTVVAWVRPGWGLGIGAGIATAAILSTLDTATEFLYYQF